MLLMVPLSVESFDDEASEHNRSDGEDSSKSGGNTYEEKHNALFNMKFSFALFPYIVVVARKYFLVFDFNGIFIHFVSERILPKGKGMKKS